MTVTLFEPHRATLTFVRADTLDDPSIRASTMDVFTASSHASDMMDPALEKPTYRLPTRPGFGR